MAGSPECEEYDCSAAADTDDERDAGSVLQVEGSRKGQPLAVDASAAATKHELSCKRGTCPREGYDATESCRDDHPNV